MTRGGLLVLENVNAVYLLRAGVDCAVSPIVTRTVADRPIVLYHP